ncbi:unnamed protein product [Coregonus sp. 'balchen']|nr:unnamed protein product [Coregonus sp. 'balchen']
MYSMCHSVVEKDEDPDKQTLGRRRNSKSDGPDKNKLEELQLLDQNKIWRITEHKRYYERKLRAVREEAELTQDNKGMSTEVYKKLQDLHL